MPHSKYERASVSAKVHVLVPRKMWEGKYREDLKEVFNACGAWAEPAELPVDSRVDTTCAIFSQEQFTEVTGRKNYSGFVGREFQVSNVRYVVFPEPQNGSLVSDESKFEQAMKLVLAVRTDKLNVITINSRQKLEEAISYIAGLRYCVVDFETKGLDPHQEGAKVLSLAAGNKDAAYVLALHHKDSRTPEEVIRKWVQAVFSVKHMVGHNAKYELRWFKSLGFPIRDIAFDPMVAHHVLDENSLHDLDTLAGVYTPYAGYKSIIYDALTDRKDYETAPLDVLLRYNGLDVIMTDLVMEPIYRRLQTEEPALLKVLTELDIPLIPVLAEAEENGYELDHEELARLIDWYTKRQDAAHRKVLAYPPLKEYFKERPNFNFGSGPQKVDLLFRELGLKPVRYTDPSKTHPRGVPSTDGDTLKILRGMGKHKPVMEALLESAKAKTMLSSFLNVFTSKSALSDDGRLRTSYNQHVVETFRLSSSGPNLQNPPRSEDLIKEGFEPIKGIFTSRFPNGAMLQADLSQIELRVSAMYSGDPPLVTAYREGRDIHSEMAERVYGPNFDKAQRYKAKRANFSAEFDISPKALAEDIGSTESEAKRLISEFQKLHSVLYEWFGALWSDAQANGFTQNFLMRKRHIDKELRDAYESGKSWRVDEVRRSVWNFPIQCTAADIMKLGLIMVYREMKRLKMKSKLVGTIHDSMIADCVPGELDTLARLIKRTFEVDIPARWKAWMTIPIRIDVASGSNLNDLKEYKFA